MIKLNLTGRRTYLSVALLVIITLAKQFNVGTDSLDPNLVTAVQTLLAGAVAWFLRAGVSESK